MYFGKRERNNQIPQNRGPVLIPILCPLPCKQTSGFPALSCSCWITKARIKICFCHTQICLGNWSVKNDIQFFNKPLCESSQIFCPQSGRRKTEMGVSGLLLWSIGHCHIKKSMFIFLLNNSLRVVHFYRFEFECWKKNYEHDFVQRIFYLPYEFLWLCFCFEHLIWMNMTLIPEEDIWAQLC